MTARKLPLTAWALLTKAERFRVHIITKLPEAGVRHVCMILAEAIESVMHEIPAKARGYILPRGAALLPVAGTR